MKPRQNASIYSANLKNYLKLAETHKGIFSRFVRDFQDMRMKYRINSQATHIKKLLLPISTRVLFVGVKVRLANTEHKSLYTVI